MPRKIRKQPVKTTPHGKVGSWFVTVTHGFIITRTHDAMKLHVGLTQGDTGEWNVLAVECPQKLSGVEILDEHAHEMIGTFDFREAVRQAEAYAKRWQKRKRRARACPCDAIDATTIN